MVPSMFLTVLCFNDSKARKEIRIIKINIHFNSVNATSLSNDGTYEDYVTSGTSLQNRIMQIDTQTHSRPVLPCVAI